MKTRSDALRVLRDHRPALVRLVILTLGVGAWVALDRWMSGYARSLMPGAPPVPLLGDWLMAQRADHEAPGLALIMTAGGAAMFLAVALLAQVPEFPVRRLALVAFACASAGWLANGLSLLLQHNVVTNFITVRVPANTAHTWLAFVPGSKSLDNNYLSLHFVPADMALWAQLVE